MSIEKVLKAKPFLRWAGGKRRIIKHLVNYFPSAFENYWEPFLGSAALFFSLQPKSAHLSDKNQELIECYKAVRDNPSLIYRYLQKHIQENSEQYYYEIRENYNRSEASIAQSARFLYLNRAGFNGIFRVNQIGEYNVPYGHKEPPPAPSRDEILAASRALQNTTLTSNSFEDILESSELQKNDFVYLDPPYPALSETANFAHYTTDRFSSDDQERTAQVANELRSKGCHVMISNSDVEKIRELFADDWFLYTLPVTRWLAANGSRHSVSELVITSYPVKILKQGELL